VLLTDATQGLAVVRVIEAVNRSMSEGGAPVTLAPALTTESGRG